MCSNECTDFLWLCCHNHERADHTGTLGRSVIMCFFLENAVENNPVFSLLSSALYHQVTSSEWTLAARPTVSSLDQTANYNQGFLIWHQRPKIMSHCSLCLTWTLRDFIPEASVKLCAMNAATPFYCTSPLSLTLKTLWLIIIVGEKQQSEEE